MDEQAFPVTQLFTDIEGSTRLWDADADRMRVALAQHDALSQQIVAAHAGRVVKTTGDGIHAVFTDPLNAILAANQLQRELHTVEHAPGVALRVRCGIHAGVSESRGGDFYGAAINRAARIMSAAHGGQVLVSQAVMELVRGRVPDEIELRDLGRVRLRDLATAERVYQVDRRQAPQLFPPLRGLDATPNNLPVLDSSFIGRVGTMAELAAALGAHRLVTITGPGGMGKTRLALQGAADMLNRFDDGVWLVELARVIDAAFVPAAVAQVLTVSEEPGKPIETSIAEFLASRNALVILDNCEHVLEACAVLANTVLRTAPNARMLATSREPLRIEGEQVFALAPLALPEGTTAPNASEAARFPAVALFAERARQHSGRFVLTDRNAAAVTQICQRLDGLPLAIELAAARVRMLGVDDIARRLDDRFRLLTGGRRTDAPRHQTLERLVAWSYELLTEQERVLFDRLGVLVGGFDLDAAREIGAVAPVQQDDVLDMVGSLVDKSLVVADVNEDGEPERYRLLETLRAFALMRLEERGEHDDARERHAAYFERMAAAEPDELDGKARGRHYARMDIEHDNLRAALTRRVAQPGDGRSATAFAIAMIDFWQARGHESEGGRWVETVLGLPFCAEPSTDRARLLSEGCVFATHQLRFDDARRMGLLALNDFRACGTPSQVASSLQKLAEVEGRQGNYDAAQRLFEDCLAIFSSAGNRVNEAKILLNIGTTFSLADDWERARHYTERAAAAGRDAGHLGVQAYAAFGLAAIEIEQDHLLAARTQYERVVPLAQQIGDKFLETLGRAGLGQVDLAEGNFERAHVAGLAALDYFVANEMRREVTYVLDDLAFALAQRNDFGTAARLFAAATKHRAAAGVKLGETEQKRLDTRTAAARRAEGPVSFDAAWADGESLTLDDAVRLARATPLPSAAASPPLAAAVRR